MRKTVLAIHQPNYMPWLGYFHKISRSDIFIFLDNVQYSKNSYINRSRVLSPQGEKWLTLPVSYNFGDTINFVKPAKISWNKSHISSLQNYYGKANAFKEVWPEVKALYENNIQNSLSEINIHFVQAIMKLMDLKTQTFRSSSLRTLSSEPNLRLIEIINSYTNNAIYLSGKGGKNYQSEELFRQNNIGLTYSNFYPRPYPQGKECFYPGLSILDAFFHLGIEQTRSFVIGEN
ncbi:WbqC family protein [Kiloniella litopenaei]|uniref:WbqC family protein n=1 Tax=Kiloniella litopenaei TaxID=1549748 RepID=UPI003BA8A26D